MFNGNSDSCKYCNFDGRLGMRKLAADFVEECDLGVHLARLSSLPNTAIFSKCFHLLCIPLKHARQIQHLGEIE